MLASLRVRGSLELDPAWREVETATGDARLASPLKATVRRTPRAKAEAKAKVKAKAKSEPASGRHRRALK